MSSNDFEEKNILLDLQKHYKDKKLILFIGAGFSKPLELPDWKELVGWMGDKLGYEKDLFFLQGNYQQLAEYVKLKNGSVWDDFILEVTTQFNSDSSNEKRKKSEQHLALSDLELKTIYTTNYDRHIENSYIENGKKVKSYSLLADFQKSITDDYDVEVVKFHGTLQNQDSIILTESQYFDRMELEEAVDQKLRSDILSNIFLFIGYSFNDLNIRYIWYKLHKLKEKQKSKNYENINSYFATFGRNEIQEELLKQWNIKIISLDTTEKGKSITELLKNIKK